MRSKTPHPFFYPLPPFLPVSPLIVIILSIRSEEVLLFLVLLIHINTHNSVAEPISMSNPQMN